MPPWVAFISGAAAAIAIGTMLVKLGVWGGHQDIHDADIKRLTDALAVLSDWRRMVESGAIVSRVDAHERELEKIRPLMHSLDKSTTALQHLYDFLDEDIKEIRKKVFDGHGRNS